MAYDKLFTQYTAEEQIQICRDMSRRWRAGGHLLVQKLNARTDEETAAINQELIGLKNIILPDTVTLLDNEA